MKCWLSLPDFNWKSSSNKEDALYIDNLVFRTFFYLKRYWYPFEQLNCWFDTSRFSHCKCLFVVKSLAQSVCFPMLLSTLNYEFNLIYFKFFLYKKRMYFRKQVISILVRILNPNIIFVVIWYNLKPIHMCWLTIE